MRRPHPHRAPTPGPVPQRVSARGTLRLFFAVWPEVEARERVAELAHVVAGQSDGRAPRPENLHLTLAFVGEVPASSVAALCAIGESVAAGSAPFAVTFDRIGAFRRAGIAWAGASVVPTGLLRLAQTLADTLADHGFPVELRAFEPHVTLARRCRKPCELAPGAPIAWTVNRLVLNVSEPARGGPRYREQRGWPLGGREP